MASTNLLKIHDQLHIDRKYFFDLSDEERSIILQWSLAFKTGDVKTNDEGHLMLDNQLFKNIARQCRVRFQYHRRETERKMSSIWLELFHVEFRDWTIDGQAIFNSIKPFEIDRLEQVLSESGNEFDKNRIKAGCQMAKIMKCRDVAGFAAVFEFTVRKLKSENDSDFQNFENNQDKQIEIKDSLNKLIAETKELHDPIDKVSLTFINDLAAANHYDKHPIVHEGNNLTPDEYIALARELASGKADYVAKDMQLTQEGLAFRCKFETDKAVALRIDDIVNGTSVIATLHPKRLKRQRKDTGAKKAPKIKKNKKKNKDGSEE